MNAQTFELMSQGLRYWIAGLTVFIFIRAARAVRRSFKVEKRQEKQEKGGFSLGILKVTAAGRNQKILGNRYVLRQENRIGKGSNCDIQIPERSLASVQALIYQRGNKVYLSDYGSRQGVGLNGYKVRDDVALMNGDEIQLCHMVLQLHLQEAYSVEKRKELGEQAYISVDDEMTVADHDGEELLGEGYGEDEDYDSWRQDDYDPYDPA